MLTDRLELVMPGASGEAEIHRAIIEVDLADRMVALASQLFYRTQKLSLNRP